MNTAIPPAPDITVMIINPVQNEPDSSSPTLAVGEEEGDVEIHVTAAIRFFVIAQAPDREEQAAQRQLPHDVVGRYP